MGGWLAEWMKEWTVGWDGREDIPGCPSSCFLPDLLHNPFPQQAGSAVSVPPGFPYTSEYSTGAGMVAWGGYMLTLLCDNNCLDW